MITGTGTGPILPWPHQTKFGIEAADRSAAGEQQRRAAKHRHAAERHDEGRHLEPGDREALERSRREADSDGGQ